MEFWILLLVLLLIWVYNRETFVDTESPVTRPERNSVWLSKIDSQAPIGGNDDDYIKVLQAFYDKVYTPATIKPEIAQVEAFLKSPDAQVAGVDTNVLRKIIGAAFRVQRTASDEKQSSATKFKISEAIQPKDGVDEVFVRKENIYSPTDSRLGDLSEGLYAPVEQQDTPRYPGIWDDNSTSWTSTSYYSVCDGGECAKNVL